MEEKKRASAKAIRKKTYHPKDIDDWWNRLNLFSKKELYKYWEGKR